MAKARPAAEAAAAGGHKVRFDSVGEEERPSSQGRRRLRGRNIVHHSDVEVASSVAAASVVSDNTHLYRRSRSAVSSKHIVLDRKCALSNKTLNIAPVKTCF